MSMPEFAAAGTGPAGEVLTARFERGACRFGCGEWRFESTDRHFGSTRHDLDGRTG